MTITIFQGIDRRWSYCPIDAVGLLRGDFGEFDTAAEATLAAVADESVPLGALFEVQP